MPTVRKLAPEEVAALEQQGQPPKAPGNWLKRSMTRCFRSFRLVIMWLLTWSRRSIN